MDPRPQKKIDSATMIAILFGLVLVFFIADDCGRRRAEERKAPRDEPPAQRWRKLGDMSEPTQDELEKAKAFLQAYATAAMHGRTGTSFLEAREAWLASESPKLAALLHSHASGAVRAALEDERQRRPHDAQPTFNEHGVFDGIDFGDAWISAEVLLLGRAPIVSTRVLAWAEAWRQFTAQKDVQ